ncbi:hypothetical protein C2E23DRAFT_141010 [Lenzites betulinus]|nr:hypothetical protein C2E23DRAFT_141010 [Lenzites betulinus]
MHMTGRRRLSYLVQPIVPRTGWARGIPLSGSSSVPWCTSHTAWTVGGGKRGSTFGGAVPRTWRRTWRKARYVEAHVGMTCGMLHVHTVRSRTRVYTRPDADAPVGLRDVLRIRETLDPDDTIRSRTLAVSRPRGGRSDADTWKLCRHCICICKTRTRIIEPENSELGTQKPGQDRTGAPAARVRYLYPDIGVRQDGPPTMGEMHASRARVYVVCGKCTIRRVLCEPTMLYTRPRLCPVASTQVHDRSCMHDGVRTT